MSAKSPGTSQDNNSVTKDLRTLQGDAPLGLWRIGVFLENQRKEENHYA